MYPEFTDVLMKRIRSTAAEMYPLVVSFLESGSPVRAFAESHGISAFKLTYWRNTYQSEQAHEDRGAFRELSAPVTGAVPSVELVLPRGACVRLYGAVPPAYVGERVRQVA